jgi:hypothetical protein
MKKVLLVLMIWVLALTSSPVQAASYKLTIFYDMGLYYAYSQSTADLFVEQLDTGEQTCEALLGVAAFRGYDTENLTPLLRNTNYKIKNESGKTIASGKFRPKTSRPGGTGSDICRVEITLSMPKAKFYDVEISGGQVLISGFPFTKFKKNQARINFFDWN